MLAHERYEKILQLIRKEGFVKSQDLAKAFQVATETIRRDLDYLQEQGLIKKVYGGAVIDAGRKAAYQTYETREVREQKNIAEKRQIAQIAVGLICNGDSIALNASTTNYELCKLLKQHFDKLTVFTNSIQIVNELMEMPGYTLVLAGGLVSRAERSTVGNLAAFAVDNFTFDKAFISVSGISLKAGITDYSIDEQPIQKKMVAASNRVYFLADHEKFNTSCLLKIADAKAEYTILTDSGIQENTLTEYRDHGFEVVNKTE